MADKIVF